MMDSAVCNCGERYSGPGRCCAACAETPALDGHELPRLPDGGDAGSRITRDNMASQPDDDPLPWDVVRRGEVSPNEARRWLGLPPLDGGSDVIDWRCKCGAAFYKGPSDFLAAHGGTMRCIRCGDPFSWPRPDPVVCKDDAPTLAAVAALDFDKLRQDTRGNRAIAAMQRAERDRGGHRP